MNLGDLPSPAEILQQLGDGVTARIDARSVTGFDTALREMADYHRLLLGLYATKDDQGRPASYAMLDDGWGGLHQSWLSPYRSVISRSVQFLEDEPDYFRSICYLPYRLLETDQRLPAPMVDSIMGLGSLTIFLLENWLTKRAAAVGRERSAEDGVVLVGSDRHAYEDALIYFVGAWEATAGSRNGLKRFLRIEDPDVLWGEYSQAWPSLVSHLGEAADCFILAAWNRDELGVQRFGDMLLRWPQTVDVEDSPYAFRHPWLLNGDLLEFDWTGAQADLAPQLQPYSFEDLTPKAVFGQIVANLHRQVVMLAAAVTLNWALSEKGGAFATEAARRLVDGVMIDPHESYRRDQLRLDAWSRLQTILALELTESSSRNETYGRKLNRLAARLDRVSERKVPSGRVYTPSTIHDVASLRWPLHLLLMSSIDTGQGARLRLAVSRLIEDEHLPGGDRALRQFEDLFGTTQRALEAVDERAREVLKRLNPDTPPEASLSETLALGEGVVADVRELRTRRIAAQPAAPSRLAQLEDIIQQLLLEGGGAVPLFDRPKIAARVVDNAPVHHFTFKGVPKLEFIEPPQGTDTDYLEFLGKDCRNIINQTLWRAFYRRPRTRLHWKSTPASQSFWRNMVRRFASTPEGTILVLSTPAYRAFARAFVYGRRADSSPLAIERRRDGVSSTYKQTVEGIEVHELGFSERGEALVLDRALLERVDYGVLGNNKIVRVEFRDDAQDPWKGEITFRWASKYTWGEGPVQHLSFPLPPIEV